MGDAERSERGCLSVGVKDLFHFNLKYGMFVVDVGEMEGEE
jgi:hypothetical protein